MTYLEQAVELIAEIARIQGAISVQVSWENAKGVEHNSAILAKKKQELLEVFKSLLTT